MAGYRGAAEKPRDTGPRAPEGNGSAMIGNHLLEYRLMKEHHERLQREGDRQRLAHLEPRSQRHLVRSYAARFGARLEDVGRRLRALDSTPAGRH